MLNYIIKQSQLSGNAKVRQFILEFQCTVLYVTLFRAGPGGSEPFEPSMYFLV